LICICCLCHYPTCLTTFLLACLLTSLPVCLPACLPACHCLPSSVL